MPALTEKDKQEGKELIDMLESLPVEEKKQALDRRSGRERCREFRGEWF